MLTVHELMFFFLVESLAVQCAEETKSPRILGCLYNYYMLTEQTDKAKELVQVKNVLYGIVITESHVMYVAALLFLVKMSVLNCLVLN